MGQQNAEASFPQSVLAFVVLRETSSFIRKLVSPRVYIESMYRPRTRQVRFASLTAFTRPLRDDELCGSRAHQATWVSYVAMPHHATELPGPLRSLDELLEEVLASCGYMRYWKGQSALSVGFRAVLHEELRRFGIDWDDIVLNEGDCLGRQHLSELGCEGWMHSCLRWPL